MVLSRLGVSELDKIQSWEATGDETGDSRLAGRIFTSYQQQLFLQAAFFFSSGNAALSFVNKISGLITALRVTGRRPHRRWKVWAAPGAGEAHRESVPS